MANQSCNTGTVMVTRRAIYERLKRWKVEQFNSQSVTVTDGFGFGDTFVGNVVYSLDTAMRGFYRAANGIFGKVGWTAFEEVVLHKFGKIYMYAYSAVWFWGAESNKSQLNSLDLVANRFLMKLFNTNNMQIIEFCCEQLNFILPIVRQPTDVISLLNLTANAPTC